MLEARILGPDRSRAGTPVVVLLHGRGADPSDLAPLRPAFPADVAVVLPRAPHAAAQWGYGPGWAWYRYEGGDRPEVESFRTSQAELESLLAGLPDLLGYDPGPVLLGGFSQGGTTALAYALRHAGAVPGVLVFSGFVPSHPDVEVTPESVADTGIWWGHGTRDPAVPHALAERGRTALERAGARLTVRDYPVGHGIIPEELRDAVTWLRGILAGQGAGTGPGGDAG
ncbi:MAG: phospholipase [Gemmatimonadetes bacterium]|nr:phospholipase [Gemmatimonadota bacterium]NIQ60211.1 phospholipase [Gemmatimonadota bacterium]NIU80426.1 phospholipase [Gammaproteobacteria bacterium]NIX48763.1 phospholipase [Gemmatimonadota bacterium]NIY13219.1 phospholipase [Gemmatimonadota bacterium]